MTLMLSQYTKAAKPCYLVVLLLFMILTICIKSLA